VLVLPRLEDTQLQLTRSPRQTQFPMTTHDAQELVRWRLQQILFRHHTVIQHEKLGELFIGIRDASLRNQFVDEGALAIVDTVHVQALRGRR